MKGDKELLRMRDIFRECADIVDRMIELREAEEKGEEVKEELEGAIGRFVMLMMELNALNNS